MRQILAGERAGDPGGSSPEPVGTVRVLLIESDPEESLRIGGYLEKTRRFKADTITASSVTAALDHLAREKFDTILLDYTPPGAPYNGNTDRDDLEAIAASARSTPVIVLTGLADDSLAIKALQKGAQEYLFKGEITGELLERSILYSIERKRADEALRLSEEQYRGVFEATSDGLVINDWEGNVVEVNPAFCRMHGYTHEEMVGMHPTTFVHPDSHAALASFFETVRDGKSFHTRAMDVRKDGSAFNVEVHGTIFMYQGEPHVLGIVRDTTEQMQAYELLEQRVEERTRELTTLLEISNSVASTLELQPLLSKTLDQLRFVTNFSTASILLVDGEELITIESRAGMTGEPQVLRRRFPLGPAGPIWDKLMAHDWVIIPNIHGDDAMARAYQNVVGDLVETRPHVKSWLAVPLVQKDNIIGLLSLSSTEPEYFTPQHATLATAVANQAAVAIENARLYEQAQANIRKTAALAQIASQVAFGGSLESTLDILCRHVVEETGAAAAAVVLRDPETGQDRMTGTHGLPDGYAEGLNAILASGVKLIMQDAFSGRRPMFMQGMREKILSAPVYGPLHGFMQEVRWDTVVAVPMVYKDTPVGVLMSYFTPDQGIGEAEMTFSTVIADQAAVAVENARLLAQAHDKARLEERQHLARELHDSVTQALFSINLIARSAELTLVREGANSPQTVEKLATLRQLTQGALAEMRALIFELRPGALEEEGLVEALRKHAAAVQGREMLPIEVVVPQEANLPRLKPAAEEGLYRIAQEALHNVVKHARATRVQVIMDVQEGSVRLQVADNGVGFDLEQVPAGHMGLGTMQQRARALGGEYEVESKPHSGTTVTVSVPIEDWQLQQ